MLKGDRCIGFFPWGVGVIRTNFFGSYLWILPHPYLPSPPHVEVLGQVLVTHWPWESQMWPWLAFSKPWPHLTFPWLMVELVGQNFPREFACHHPLFMIIVSS